jgi:hypothetical protein
VRPGTDVAILDSAPPRSAPQTTDAAFFVGLTEQGPLGPQLVETLADFRTRFGARVSYGALYDALEVFFREGGSRAYISRVVGASAVVAGRTLNDGSAVATIKVSAIGPGAFANVYTVAVATVSGGFTITVADGAGTVITRSPVLADKNAAVDWGVADPSVDVTIAGAGGNPATLSAAVMSGGTDDRASVVDTDWRTALNRFTPALGPGQVLAPGNTAAASRTYLLQHASANRRIALLDASDTATVATVVTEVTTIRTNAGNDVARWGALFAPWIRVNGIAAGTTREVAPSSIVAGIMGRNDVAGTAIGQPSAGTIYGISRTALALAQPYTDTDTATLYNAQANSIRTGPNGIMVYGDQALCDPLVYPLWQGLGSNRTVMKIAAQADAILQNHVFAVMDGQGHEFAKLAGELVGMLMPIWEEGSLYGATFDEAARVDTGPKVNTPASIAARELHATVAVKTSPAADWVTLNLVRVATTETL